MEESVLFPVVSVPTCVGLSPMGGGLRVTLGSQRMSPAVVSCVAMEREEGFRKLRRRLSFDGAVLTMSQGSGGKMQKDG